MLNAILIFVIISILINCWIVWELKHSPLMPDDYDCDIIIKDK